jgi:outer membrane protein assembly factor BamB
MKSISKVAVCAIIVTVCVVLAVFLLNARYRMLSERYPSEDSNQIPVIEDVESTPGLTLDSVQDSTVNNRTDWPMFRGQQRLLGTQTGSIPDSPEGEDFLKLIWKFKTDDQIKSSPAIVDDIVYIGSSDEHIYAIDIKKGKQLWKYKTGDTVEGTPCVIEGSVYVGSSDGFLYALDANSGELKWKYETGGEILGSANWVLLPDDKTIWVLIGSYDNKLHCVDSTDGNVVWTYETDNFINGSPAVEKNVSVFGGCDAMIHVVSLAEGDMVKSIDSGSYIAASAAILDGQVYVGNYDNVFIKADIATGKILWKYEQGKAPFFSSPAIGRDFVVVGARDELVHCIGRNDGKKVWTFQTLGEVDSSPVICGDKVIVGSEDGRLYVLRLSDGSKLWSYEIGQAITSSPAVTNSMIIIGCDDGFVYAFGSYEADEAAEK